MDMNIVIDVLNEIKNFYENSTGSKSLEDFRLWLNEKAYSNENPSELTKKLDLEVHEIENEIAKQIILLNRYSKLIIKKALENNNYLVNEDFTYLFRMMNYSELTKSQLIEKNAHEKQTGTEIINRLIKKGLLVEKPNTKDKRSVQISISELGKEVFFQAMKEITKASRIMSGKLKSEEKTNFLDYLKRLNHFHHHIYISHKNMGIDEIENML